MCQGYSRLTNGATDTAISKSHLENTRSVCVNTGESEINASFRLIFADLIPIYVPNDGLFYEAHVAFYHIEFYVFLFLLE